MSFQITCLILIILGAGILAAVSWRYHRFMRRGFIESDAWLPQRRTMVIFVSVCLMFFILSLAAGWVEIFRHRAEGLYLFVGMVFFAGSIFLASVLLLQMKMIASLRKNTDDIVHIIGVLQRKDPYITDHSQHVYNIMRLLYEELPAELQGRLNYMKLLDAALLHDVGKINVDNAILCKSGALDSEERRSVREHTLFGKNILAEICLAELGEWVQYHHERVDGSGYYGLTGDEIPLESRLIAVADTYSAITTGRPYQPRLNHREAILKLKSAAGTQLDPELVECFCRIPEDQLDQILPGENHHEIYYEKRLFSGSAA